MKTDFPRVIYVIIDAESDSLDDPMLLAATDPAELGLPNAVIPMARYVLEGQGEIIHESKYTETEGK